MAADQVRRVHAEAVTVELRGLARLNPAAASWVGAALAGLPAAPPGEPDVLIEVMPVGVPGRRAEHGVALVPDGVWLGDRLGRGAVLALGDTPLTARVDPSIPAWYLGYGVHLFLTAAAAWRRRIVILRAAVVEVEGRRLAIAGWSGGGKTRVVLELLRRGGGLLGDDVVALAPDGTVHPLLTEVTIRPAHADQLPEAAGARASSRALAAAARLLGGSGASRSGAQPHKSPEAARNVGPRRMSLTSRNRILFEVTARLADVARSASERTVAVSSVFPGAGLGDSGRLDALLLLRDPGPDDRDVPQSLACFAGSYHLLHRATELAALHHWSGRLREPLLPTFSARRAAFAAALEDVAVLEADPAHDRAAAVALADRLTKAGR